MSFMIREANHPEEIEKIARFRYEVYIEEMGKPMLEADHSSRTLRDSLDAGATHMFAARNGEVVGSLRIAWGESGIPKDYYEWYGLGAFSHFPSSAFSFTGRLMVAKDLRATRLALNLLCFGYRIAREHRISFDFAHTTPPLVRFFQRIGHRLYRENFVDPQLGQRIPMVGVLDDHEHLEAIRSPFRTIASQFAADPYPPSWFTSNLAHSRGDFAEGVAGT